MKKLTNAIYGLLPVRTRRRHFRLWMEEGLRPKESLPRQAARVLSEIRGNEFLVEKLASLSGLSLVELAIELKKLPFGVKREFKRLGVIQGKLWKPSMTFVGHELTGIFLNVRQASTPEERSSRIDEVLVDEGF